MCLWEWQWLGVYLSIEVISQAGMELTLYGVLLREQGEVVAQLVMWRDDGALSVFIKLRTASTAKNLHHIQDAQVHQCAPLRIIDLSTL